MESVLEAAQNCTLCAGQLPHEPRPVFVVHPKARILVIGQAPGRKVHESGIPWADASGKRLRAWMGVDEQTFYDAENFAILPMGFCFPGSGRSGDLPPRPECAPQWHRPLLNMMPDIQLTLLFGQYALERYLGDRRERNLTETVRNWRTYGEEFLPLPHPSPRNQIWERKNPWFGEEILPYLQEKVAAILFK
jgi:uracil-DNA glycosylase